MVLTLMLLRVTLASDSTGQVTLASGAAVAVTQTTSPWIVAGGGTAGSSGTAVLTVQGIASGTALPVSGPFNILPKSASTYALTAFDLAATAATNVKASAGNVWAWYEFNPNASTCHLQFYNSTSATLGTSALHAFGI